MQIEAQKSHSIAVILFDDFMSLDVTGPVDSMMAANKALNYQAGTKTQFYNYQFISAGNLEVRSSAGMKFLANATIAEASPTNFDAILVPGGDGVEQAAENKALIDWIAAAHKASVRTISVCSGSWLLALAGALEGKKCATHWRLCSAMAKAFLNIQVDQDSLYVADGKVISSAGVTSGIDMTLALIEADMGREVALHIARRLVVHFKRPGNQSQFSWPLKAQTATTGNNVGRAVEWALKNIDQPLMVEDLAEHAGMSVRNFSRHFKKEIGDTPARFIEQARLENARLLLDENTAIPLPQAAAASGFSSCEHLTRAFERRFGLHPNAYRENFALN
jgi:transcriptional regulator GlxA family with amidase domain